MIEECGINLSLKAGIEHYYFNSIYALGRIDFNVNLDLPSPIGELISKKEAEVKLRKCMREFSDALYACFCKDLELQWHKKYGNYKFKFNLGDKVLWGGSNTVYKIINRHIDNGWTLYDVEAPGSHPWFNIPEENLSTLPHGYEDFPVGLNLTTDYKNK